MMQEMVERVARAMCDARGDDPDRMARDDRLLRQKNDIEHKVPLWITYLPLARAAIEAMREPTEAMNEAGAEGYCDHTMGDESVRPPSAAAVFRAMIDAALSKSP